MAEITFYRQTRQDGGVRMGIMIDGTVVRRHFESRGDNHDPALTWYVDVRAKGSRLPETPEEACTWLISMEPIIGRGLIQLAEKLEVGMDMEGHPLEHRISGTSKGLVITIVCSAVRRMVALEIADVLRDISEHWTAYVRQVMREPALSS